MSLIHQNENILKYHFERRPATNSMKEELKNFLEELKMATNTSHETSDYNIWTNNISVNGVRQIYLEEYNIVVFDK